VHTSTPRWRPMADKDARTVPGSRRDDRPGPKAALEDSNCRLTCLRKAHPHLVEPGNCILGACDISDEPQLKRSLMTPGAVDQSVQLQHRNPDFLRARRFHPMAHERGRQVKRTRAAAGRNTIYLARLHGSPKRTSDIKLKKFACHRSDLSRRSRSAAAGADQNQILSVAIDMQGLLKSGVASWLSGAATRIGFAKPASREQAWLACTHAVRPTAAHVVDRNCELLAPLGVHVAHATCDMPHRPVSRLRMAQWIASLRLPRPPLIIRIKNRSANGTSARVGRAARSMRSNSRDWPGWMRRSLRGAEEPPIHAQGRIFLVGADRS
jgi:hypothetical protein